VQLKDNLRYLNSFSLF